MRIAYSLLVILLAAGGSASLLTGCREGQHPNRTPATSPATSASSTRPDAADDLAIPRAFVQQFPSATELTRESLWMHPRVSKAVERRNDDVRQAWALLQSGGDPQATRMLILDRLTSGSSGDFKLFSHAGLLCLPQASQVEGRETNLFACSSEQWNFLDRDVRALFASKIDGQVEVAERSDEKLDYTMVSYFDGSTWRRVGIHGAQIKVIQLETEFKEFHRVEPLYRIFAIIYNVAGKRLGREDFDLDGSLYVEDRVRAEARGLGIWIERDDLRR